MVDLSHLTHDELADHLRCAFLEAEERISANTGDEKLLRRLKMSHALAGDVADSLVSAGIIRPLDGDPKPPQ